MRPIIAALLTTVIPTLVGRRWVSGSAPLRLGVGSLVGIALLGGGATIGGLVGSFEAGAAAAMIGGWFAGERLRRGAGSPGTPPHVLTVAAVGVVGCFLLILSVWRPVAGFDAWAIWSLKAKAIAATGDLTGPVFTDEIYRYSHRDYPPLLPAWQATAYRISGDLGTGFPTQFQLAWLWTGTGLALVSLAARRRAPTGLILLAWLLGPQMVEETMSGYADVPMALFLVTGTAALLRAGDLGIAPGALLLAAAALLKTEGLIFAIAVLLPLVATRAYRRPALVAATVLAVAFGPWAAFTVVHGLAGDLIRPPPEDPLVETDRDLVERFPTVIRSFATESTRPASWGLLVPVSVVALSLSRPRPFGVGAMFLLAAAALIIIYLLTPYEIEWHLSRSADRVVIAPLGLLALAAEGTGLFQPKTTNGVLARDQRAW